MGTSTGRWMTVGPIAQAKIELISVPWNAVSPITAQDSNMTHPTSSRSLEIVVTEPNLHRAMAVWLSDGTTDPAPVLPVLSYLDI